MPTYEYACTSCGEHVEVVQSFRDDPLTTCPACGGPLRKVFGSIGVVFKGSGFYKTDSRSGKSAAKTASTDTSPGSGSGTDTKTESSKESTTKSDSAPTPAAAASAGSTTSTKTAAAS